MGLDIEREHVDRPARGRFFIVTERLYKTKDGEIVSQGHPEANSLFKPAGARIPIKEAIALGIVREEPVKEKAPKSKQAPKAKDKQAKTPSNKKRG